MKWYHKYSSDGKECLQGGRLLSLGQEDLLEKIMATHSSILAWEIPWTEEPVGLYCPWGPQKSWIQLSN